jgi:hypothetical protein
MSRSYLLLAVLIVGMLAFSSAYAANTAAISNITMTDHDSYWTLSFDLANKGPANDAIFHIQVSDIPNAWVALESNPYAVWGLGMTPVNLMDGFKYSWDGSESGPNLEFQCNNGSSTGWYRIYGNSGAASPNKFQGTSARFSWNFVDNGYDPSQFILTPELFKVHFQIIDNNWQNAGKSYVGGTDGGGGLVPEPSSLLGLLGMTSTAGMLLRKRLGARR